MNPSENNTEGGEESSESSSSSSEGSESDDDVYRVIPAVQPCGSLAGKLHRVPALQEQDPAPLTYRR